jgi:myo-inositol-1(or 4)-monophosphatase
MIDPASLAPLVGPIVGQAGQLALDLWPGHGHAPRIWEKGPDNPVCEADIAVDRFLHQALGDLLPEAGWLSEETVDDPPGWRASCAGWSIRSTGRAISCAGRPAGRFRWP